MKNKNSDIVMTVLKALLNGRTLNRKDFNNGSLHSWISTLQNQRFIPIEKRKTDDGTCDYFMKPEEIARYKNQKNRKKQQDDMKLVIERERQQMLLADFHTFLKRLVEYPFLWSLWEGLPFELDDIAREINALFCNNQSANQ